MSTYPTTLQNTVKSTTNTFKHNVECDEIRSKIERSKLETKLLMNSIAYIASVVVSIIVAITTFMATFIVCAYFINWLSTVL